AYYIPLAHDYEGAPEQLNREVILKQIKLILEDPTVKKIGHHLKYDAHILQNHGIELQGWYFDTMLASYVLNSVATRHGMDDVARLYLSHLTTTFEQVAGKGVKQKTFNQIEIEIAAHYAAEDAHVTYRLYEVLDRKLKEIPELSSILHNIEMPVARVLTMMEENGIELDLEFLDQLSVDFAETIQNLENQIIELAGQSFNVSSPKQVGEILFDKLGLKGGKKTATGQYSTSESILEKIDHPITALILEYRGLSKLKSTYTDGLQKQANNDSGRVHTSYHQALTATGRLSSTDPNLQNIPVREEIGRQIRKAFVAPKGRVLLAADYSQIELRLMAHFSQDDALVHAFNHGQDVHRRTAAEVLGIALEDVTHDQRRQAKAVNFGLLYGMSEFGLIRQLGFTRQESQDYIKQYFHRYPGIYEYMQRTRQVALEQGFVETILGRRLYTPDIDARNMMVRKGAERAAINAPLQGSAADIIKMAMIEVDKILPKDQAKMLLQVPQGEIKFEEVSFAYNNKNVIDHLNLTIKPGEKIGIVGRSGAGKSTLIQLLLHFYEINQGRISIDGQNIQDVTQDSLRKSIALVTQDTSLLHRTVAENIKYGRPNATDEQMFEAVRKAKAEDFIPQLTDLRGKSGYEAYVGERGVKLSGGQRQRIAIARVFLKDAPILILDEATSALDSEVEAAIQSSLDELMKGKTVIAIAHRLSTIAQMDRLIVLDQGHIAEQGTHDELVALGGIYAHLWQRQTGSFLIEQQALKKKELD
ncbi:MAG: DNA polymerase, partial [Acinetobacter sp.]